MATTWRLDEFRWRNDNGSETLATWAYALHTNATPTLTGDLKLRLRIQASEQGSTAAALTGRLYVQKNGTGGFVQITGSDTNGCKIVDSTNLTDDEATTQQISSVTWIAGKCDDVNGQCTATASIARYSGTEHEYMLQFTYSQLNDGDYFEFREYNSTSAFATYTYTPRITISKPALTASASEAATGEESPSAAQETSSSASEAASTAENEDASGSIYSMGLTESGSPADALDATQTWDADLTEAATAGDDQDYSIPAINANITEAVSATDLQDATQFREGDISDPGNGSEAADALQVREAAIAEVLSALDDQDISQVFESALDETANASETQTSFPEYSATLTEIANVEDSSLGLFLASAGLVEEAVAASAQDGVLNGESGNTQRKMHYFQMVRGSL